MASVAPLCIFVDEAGDLGFHARASKVFVVGCVILEDPNGARVSIRRLKKEFGRRLRRFNEFKHSRDSKKVREEVFGVISEIPMSVGATAINKGLVNENLREKKAILYNFLVADGVASDLMNLGASRAILVMDRSMSAEAIAHFNDYFKRKVSWKGTVNNSVCQIVNIKHENSYDEPNLQIADYIAGAIFDKFERGNSDEYSIIKNKIKYTHGWGVDW